MFLDDELKEIYEKYDVSTNDGFVQCLTEILETCRKKCVENQNDYYLPANLKRIDASYQLFCDKCKPPFKKDYFRYFMWKILGKDRSAENLFKHILHWEIPSE